RHLLQAARHHRMGVTTIALAGLVTTLGGVTVDWSTGTLRVRVGAPGGVRAPSPPVARAAAEGLAARRGAWRSRGGVGGLPALAGGTAADRIAHDVAQKKRSEQAFEAPTTEDAEYASDGGVELVVRIALDALAGALEADDAAGEDASSIPDAGAPGDR